MDSVYAATTLSLVFSLANVANTDQIRGLTLRFNHSNTSIYNSR